MSPKTETILQSLTLEEKITLLAGKDFWETVPIPGKGVPAIKVRPPLVRCEPALNVTRPAMDPMVPVVRSSLVAQELHASQLLFARLLPGIPSSPRR